jgi:hypothetical protein
MKLSKRDSIDKQAVMLCPWYQNGVQGTLLAFPELAHTCCCVLVSAGTTHTHGGQAVSAKSSCQASTVLLLTPTSLLPVCGAVQLQWRINVV